MFGEPHVICEHVDAGQKVRVFVVLIFFRQVLRVAEQGRRDNIYLRGISANLPAKSAYDLSLKESTRRSLPNSLHPFGQNESTYRYTSIKFLDVNMLPFPMALSHNVRRVLNYPPYHGRKLAKSLFGE